MPIRQGISNKYHGKDPLLEGPRWMVSAFRHGVSEIYEYNREHREVIGRKAI